MLHIAKIDACLKILTDNKVKAFIVINFGKYFKSTREKLCSKLFDEQNLREVAESLYVFLKTPDEAENYGKMTQSNSFDNFVHCYNIENMNCH